MTLQAGDPERLGDYWLAARLGAGGQGVVYEAYDGSGARVALKVLHYDASSFVRERFEKELESARRVASFCTAQILDSETQGERPYIVSEYIPGPTLGARLRDEGPLSADETTRLAVGIATALTAIHQAGVVHRDLKPGNVLLGPDGPRIIDFGIARTSEMSLTATGALMGTYGYMPPEVLAGRRATAASDIFAWGALILYCAGGEEPFRGGNLAEVAYRTATVEPALSAVPARLRPLVAAALAKEPERRPSASEVLQGLIGAMPPSADPRLALLQAGAEAAEFSGASAAAGTHLDLGLGARAEQAYAALSDAYHLAVQSLLLRLVVPGSAPDGSQDSVRTAAPEELSGAGSDEEAAVVQVVIAALADAGILVVGVDGSVRPISMALLPAWPRLRGWVQQDRDGLALRNRLGEAALVWDRGGRRGDDLQHGSVLRTTLDWSATAAAHLRPSPIETRFLTASRVAATRSVKRRRQLLSTLSVFVVAALVAGLFAVQQRREARQQQERTIARSTAQAAESLRASDPVNAMLLSLAAWRISPTEEARASLLAAATQREADAFQVPHGIRDLEVANQILSADGRLLVLNVRGKSQIWDLTKKKQLLSLDRFEGMQEAEIVDISGGSRYALISWADGRHQGLDLVSGTLAGPQMKHGDGATSINDQGQIVVSLDDEGGGYEIWDAVTGQATITETLSFQAALSPDGSLLARCDPYPSVSLQRLSSDGKWTRVDLDELPDNSLANCFGGGGSRMRFSPDGSRLMAGDAAALWVWDTQTGALVTEMQLEDPPEGVEPEMQNLSFSTDGRHVLGYSASSGLLVWREGLTPEPIYAYDRQDLHGVADPGIVTYALNSERKELVVVTRNGSQVQTLDLSRAIAPDPLTLPMGQPETAMSSNGEYGVVNVGGPYTPQQVYSMRSGELVGHKVPLRQRTPTGPNLAPGEIQALSNDGGLLAFEDSHTDQLDGGTDLVVYDVRKGHEVLRKSIAQQDSVINSVSLSADGKHVAVWTGKTVDGMAVQVWNVSRGAPQRFADAQGQMVFSPDGRTLVTTRGQVLDLATGKVKTGALGSIPLTGTAFSADGHSLVTTTAEGWVELRDTGTWRLIGRMPSSTTQGAIYYGAQLDMPTFSPDGKTLAARVGYQATQFWDVSSRIALGDALHLGGGTLTSMRFDNRGVLRMIGNSNRRRAFNPAAETAAKQICNRAGRDITPDVWRTYVPDAPYRTVCT